MIKSKMLWATSCVAIGLAASASSKASVIDDFLLIGTGPSSAVIAGTISNYEIGANQAPVPATSAYGPGLFGNVPNLPPGIKPVPTGVTNDANVAIVSPTGQFNFSNTGVYSTGPGVQCAQSAAGCTAGASNTAFNQPGYPNNSAGTTSPFNPAFQLQSGNGLTGGVNFTNLLNQLAAEKSNIQTLAAAPTSTVNFGSGALTSDLTTVLVSGLNVIRLQSSGDIDIKANWVIDGPADASAILFVPDGINFKVSSGNILAGAGLADLDRLIIASLGTGDGQKFNFNQAVVNGVAFWVLFGSDKAEITFNDVQGCTQLIAAKINLSDVRLSQCGKALTTGGPGPGPSPVPLPAPVLMLLTSLAGLGLFSWWRRRKTIAA